MTTSSSSGNDGVAARTAAVRVADVLEILRARTGVDFTCYRPAMLERRITRHFATSGATSSEDYLRQLQGSPGAAFRLLAATEDDGVLCLGEAEWPLPLFEAKLQPLAHRTRLFRVRATAAPFAADQQLNRAGIRGPTRL